MMVYYIESLDIRGLSKDDLRRLSETVHNTYIRHHRRPDPAMAAFAKQLDDIINDPDCHIAPREERG